MAEKKARTSNKTNKKKSTAKNSQSGAGKRAASSAVSSAAQRKTVDELIKEEKHQQKQNWAVVLFAIALLLFFIVVIPGESVWQFFHNVMIGIFGWAGAVLVPIAIMYTAVICALDKQNIKLGASLFYSICIVVLVSSIVFAFTSDTYYGKFGEILSELFERAAYQFNSGILGGLIGYPMIKLAGKTGARITLILVLFVLIMFATRTGLISLFKMMAKPVKKSADIMRGERAVKQQPQPIYINEGNIPPSVPRLQSDTGIGNSVRKRKNSEIDIPLDDEFVPPPDDYYKKNRKTNQKAKAKKTDDNPNLNQNTDEAHSFFKSEETKKNPVQQHRAFFDIPLDNEPSASDYEAAGKNGNMGDINTVSQFENINGQDAQPDNAQTEQDGTTEKDKPILNSEQTKEIMQLINKVKNDQIKNNQKDTTGISEQGEETKTKYEYQRPPITMYNNASAASQQDIQSELKQTAEKLVDTLRSFGIETRIVGISRGPSVTRYELQPAAGVKISRITNLTDDIALGLAALSVRIEAPIPGRSAIGVEIPNHVRSSVSLREVLESPEFRRAKSKITVALGRDITGKVVVTDLAKMPHLLIAGTTGSGKSVTVQCMIQSVLYNSTPDEVKILLIDPKRVEFKAYNGIPNLLVPVVTEPRKAAGALGWAVTEMLKRYNTFADLNVRDIYDYNELAAMDEELDPMPQILIIVDEFSDLMMTAKNEVEDYVCRLAQMARAAGMHLVIATQRPSTDVITGLIKANIPSRLALSVSNNTDSRVILDTGGAEQLLGNGDMLFSPISENKPLRIQGCFVSIKEITAVTDFLRKQQKEDYDESVIDEIDKQAAADNTIKDDSDEAQDELLPQAIEIVVDVGEASATLLQRRLRLGYARAGRLVDTMERMGIVGPHEGSKPRKVLISRQEWLQMKMNNAD